MIEQEILKRIYPSVVTYKGDWQQMIKDISKFELTEISLFLTGTDLGARKQIYKDLEKSTVKKISHVHARHDMEEAELDYLVSRYDSKVFTIHYNHAESYIKSKHQKKFFIESNDKESEIKDPKFLDQFGGICIDLSHFEQFKVHNKPYYEVIKNLAQKYKVGCNHLSALLVNSQSWHEAKDETEISYVKNIPENFFSQYINLELINPIFQQLKFRKYLAKILAKQWNKKS